MQCFECQTEHLSVPDSGILPVGEITSSISLPSAGRSLEDAVAVFVHHRGGLFGIAYRIVGITVEAEDVVQEVWPRRPKTAVAFMTAAASKHGVHQVLWVFTPSRIAAFLDSRSRVAATLGLTWGGGSRTAVCRG